MKPILLLLPHLFSLTSTTELTFELPDKEKSCFHELIPKNTQVFFEFEVASGGNLDVDCTITGPSNEIIFSVEKESFAEKVFETDVDEAEYTFCFSNEFSSFTHKVVYFNLQVGNENDEEILFPDKAQTDHVYTKSEMATIKIYEKLKTVIDYQTHHRLRESAERKFSEGLRDRVQMWSLLQFSIMVAVSLLQVMVVRSFFRGAGKRGRRPGP